MLEMIVFSGVTLVLAFVSRSFLSHPRSHGFYRFFAWEFMLGLFVLNMRHWYDRSDPGFHIISGILFAASLFLVLFGIGLLKMAGKPDSDRDDAPLFEFEKTTSLVTTGIYGHIRHPIYGSLFLLCWGFFFKHPSLAGGILALVACGFLLLATRAEEAENIRYFGNEYREYMKRTRMFVPFIF